MCLVHSFDRKDRIHQQHVVVVAGIPFLWNDKAEFSKDLHPLAPGIDCAFPVKSGLYSESRRILNSYHYVIRRACPQAEQGMSSRCSLGVLINCLHCNRQNPRDGNKTGIALAAPNPHFINVRKVQLQLLLGALGHLHALRLCLFNVSHCSARVSDAAIFVHRAINSNEARRAPYRCIQYLESIFHRLINTLKGSFLCFGMRETAHQKRDFSFKYKYLGK